MNTSMFEDNIVHGVDILPQDMDANQVMNRSGMSGAHRNQIMGMQAQKQFKDLVNRQKLANSQKKRL